MLLYTITVETTVLTLHATELLLFTVQTTEN